MIVVPSRRAAAALVDHGLRAGPGRLRSRATRTSTVVTLREAVERALAAHPDPRPRLDGPGFRFLVSEVVADLEPEARRLFGPGIDRPGAAHSIAAAIAALRSAGLSAGEVAGAAGSSRRTRALAAALDAYERRLGAIGRWDDALAVRQATGIVAAGGWPTQPIDRLEVRGLYDATTLQGELLLALARRARSTRVHVPFDPADPEPHAYAYPYLHLWESLVDPALDVDLRFVEGKADGDRPPRVEFAAAVDPTDEARRVADRIRAWADHGRRPEEIGIVVAGGGLAALARELDRRGVPFHARRAAPLVETPLFAALLLPFRLLAEGWPRDAVRAWAASPLTTALDPEVLLPAITAGPVAGGTQGEWNRALSRARGESAARLVAALRELAALERREATPADFWAAYDRVASLVGLEPAGPGGTAWDAWRDARADLRAGLEAIDRWDGPPVGWRAHHRWLREALAGRRAGVGRPGRGVEILTPHDARSLAFRALAVCGLSRGALARPDPAAAVFGDRERRRLNDALGRRLFRTRADDALEGSLLLAERIRTTVDVAHLSFPAEDEEGSPLLPALELERERERRGVPPLAAGPPPTPPAWRRDAGADRVSALQSVELDRTRFFAFPPGTRSARAGRFDGAFSEERARRLVADGGAEAVSRWSASALESWRQCPHRYFQGYVLGLRETEERPLEALPTAVGNLAHEALRILYLEGVAGTPDRARVDDAVERAGEALRDVDRGAPEVWAVVRRRVAATLEAYLEHVAERPDREGFRPVAFELGFGLDDDGLPAIEVDTPAGAVRLRGRIDRLDRHPGTGRLHVIDYKYSRKKKSHAEAVDEAACGVDRFQLHAYFLGAHTWAEQKGLGSPPSVTGTVHCVRQPAVLEPLVAPPTDAIREGIAAAVVEAVSGRYDPSPRDDAVCAWCDFRRTCRIATVPGIQPPPGDPEDER